MGKEVINFMVHKLGELDSRYGMEKMLTNNHKAGIHSFDVNSVNGAKSWLEEMDKELEMKEREIDKFNEDIEKKHLEHEQEQEEWERKQDLEDAKQKIEEEKQEVSEQREEIFRLRKELLEKEITEPRRAPSPIIMEEPRMAVPTAPEEVYIERRPPAKPILEEVKEQIPKITATLAKAGKFLEQIPKKIFPEKPTKEIPRKGEIVYGEWAKPEGIVEKAKKVLK
jgi:hypothetical protein